MADDEEFCADDIFTTEWQRLLGRDLPVPLGSEFKKKSIEALRCFIDSETGDHTIILAPVLNHPYAFGALVSDIIINAARFYQSMTEEEVSLSTVVDIMVDSVHDHIFERVELVSEEEPPKFYYGEADGTATEVPAADSLYYAQPKGSA